MQHNPALCSVFTTAHQISIVVAQVVHGNAMPNSNVPVVRIVIPAGVLWQAQPFVVESTGSPTAVPCRDAVPKELNPASAAQSWCWGKCWQCRCRWCRWCWCRCRCRCRCWCWCRCCHPVCNPPQEREVTVFPRPYKCGFQYVDCTDYVPVRPRPRKVRTSVFTVALDARRVHIFLE